VLRLEVGVAHRGPDTDRATTIPAILHPAQQSVAGYLVHLGLVGCLCAIGAAPGAGAFVLFGIAAFSLYLLAVLSVPAIVMKLPPRDWRLLRLVTMTYIAFAFAVDFLAYLPFSALVIAGFLLRLAALAVLKRGEPISAATLSNVSQSLAGTTGVYGSANDPFSACAQHARRCIFLNRHLPSGTPSADFARSGVWT
jgi:hypothetical protein